MEVFFSEGFGGVAGSVDDANGTFVAEDRDGEGVHPAGVGAGLGEPAGAGNGEGGLGGFGDQLDHAAVRGGELVVGMSAQEGEVWDPDQGDSIRLKLAPNAFSYLLSGGSRVEVFWHRWTED